MKKFILSAVAVAAFGIGGVAQADIIDGVGNTISRIFGVPYDPTPSGAIPGPNQFGSYRDQWGRTVYLGPDHRPAYVEQDGRLIPYASAPGSYAMSPSYDRDGDGIADAYDRTPYDPRYR